MHNPSAATRPRLSAQFAPLPRVDTTWPHRLNTALDRLEQQARRTFQLEEELSQFAQDYYASVGILTERLIALDEAPESAAPEATGALAAVLAQCDARAERRAELKARYRSLAKDLHPDRAALAPAGSNGTNQMPAVNAAYQQGDLAALLRLEAQMLLTRMAEDTTTPLYTLSSALREVDRAADTYAESYRVMLRSPINELMLRALSARLAGWDWVHAVRRKIERKIEEKERALALAAIAQISLQTELQPV